MGHVNSLGGSLGSIFEDWEEERWKEIFHLCFPLPPMLCAVGLFIVVNWVFYNESSFDDV